MIGYSTTLSWIHFVKVKLFSELPSDLYGATTTCRPRLPEMRLRALSTRKQFFQSSRTIMALRSSSRALDSAEDLHRLLGGQKLRVRRGPRAHQKIRAAWRQDSAEFEADADLPAAPATAPLTQHIAAAETQQQLAAHHNTWTQTLVAASTLPFLFLLLPQVRPCRCCPAPLPQPSTP